uniref:helix-turn-helix domain-containing protein n=1 Tax=uncultured Gordonia sp. TaxID=198437 RepID=UPI002597B48D
MTTASTRDEIPIMFPQPLRLELARRHARLSQAELAQALGVSTNTVNRYERDQVSPKRSVVMAWSMVTGVSLAWLETGEAPPPDGGGASIVRHQGLEPRTRWFGVSHA